MKTLSRMDSGKDSYPTALNCYLFRAAKTVVNVTLLRYCPESDPSWERIEASHKIQCTVDGEPIYLLVLRDNETHLGTPSYVDPEYHECYQLTDKSDVFSFGVVLIGLISSKPAVDITRHHQEINLSNMAINKIQNQALHELVDPSPGFESDYNIRTMITLVTTVAFQCLQGGKDMRPMMREVHEALKEVQSGNYNKVEVGD
ncbi:hypothetical protein SLEP1_g47228 [Rubroshorea leprosula]|uniref:Serine-threonine/tyrosine-protein kinase catalytic domain-containing protein n=1 Tax=Rubroshorea leprosula TaxID=152421 RepID=A0AAV5LPT4_9ROSI|nr:hypothetical protein SLEP1_g47228 [Rubroshorea leprosula]